MLRATWKSLWSRKWRLFLSTLSISLGIAFIAGSMIFTNKLDNSFNDIIYSTSADVNVVLDEDGPRKPDKISSELTDELLAEIEKLSGVSKAEGDFVAFDVYPMDTEGRLLSLGGAPGLGILFRDSPAMGGRPSGRVVAGRVPTKDSEVALDPTTLLRSGYRIGDDIDIYVTNQETRSYQIVGTATLGNGGTAGASYTFMTLAELRRISAQSQPLYTGGWITITESADADKVANEVNSLLPAGLKAVTGEKQANEIEESLSIGLTFLNSVLLIFAAISLLVAALLIVNTFSILISQRTRELALLRALGASRSQVRTSVLVEAFVVAIVGATIGLGIGFLLVWGVAIVLSSLGVNLGEVRPNLTWQIAVISYVVAIATTLAAAYFPARKASATRPVEAMTRASAGEHRDVGVSAYVGIALLEVGIAAVVCGLWLNVGDPLYWVGPGLAGILVGAVLGNGVLGKPLLWLLGKIAGFGFGSIGKLAHRNIVQQPRRAAATAATLVIGLTLVSAVAILAASTNASVRADITENQRGDFVVSAVNFRPFPRSIVTEAASIDGVEDVWLRATTQASYNDSPIVVTGTTPQSLNNGIAVDVLAGELQTHGVMLSYNFAVENDQPMGSLVELATGNDLTLKLRVTGIFDGDSAPRLGDAIVAMESYGQLGDSKVVDFVSVAATAGADLAEVQTKLQAIVEDIPTVVVTSNQEYADQVSAQFDQVFAVLYALLGLGLVISVLGIMNTLILSVTERTREIGLLRAIGLTRGQLRVMIAIESVIISLIGTVIGLVIGLVAGHAIVMVLNDAGVTQVTIPWVQLLVFLVVAVVFGLVAALVPSQRAAKLNVLDAIAVE
ncbi:MAG: hypothetical protein CSA64_02655 [Arachnia propionica]|nr:MAG: hypothetical protein CSA64_02655 [Arachnia propionica]